MTDEQKVQKFAEAIRHHPNLRLQRLASAILDVGAAEVAERLLGVAPMILKTDKEA